MTAWVLLRVSLEVATSSYPLRGARDHLGESVEMCGLPSYRLLPAPFCECWGRVATRGGVQAPQYPGPLELRSLHMQHEQHKLRGSYDKLAAQSSLVSPRTSPSSLYRKVATAVHA